MPGRSLVSLCDPPVASSKKDGDRITGYGPHKLGRQGEEHRAPDRRKRPHQIAGDTSGCEDRLALTSTAISGCRSLRLGTPVACSTFTAGSKGTYPWRNQTEMFCCVTPTNFASLVWLPATLIAASIPDSVCFSMRYPIRCFTKYYTRALYNTTQQNTDRRFLLFYAVINYNVDTRRICRGLR